KPARPAGFRGGLCGDDPCVDCSVLPASLARHANRSHARPPGGMIFLFSLSLLFCFALSGQTNVITWASDAHLHVLSNLNFEIAVCTFRFGFPSTELLESLYESVGRPVYRKPDHSFDRQRTRAASWPGPRTDPPPARARNARHIRLL